MCSHSMFFLIIAIFYPLGADPTYPLISQFMLRCSPGRLGRVVVENHNFIGRRLHICEWVGWVGLNS
jgi:hypothetical protein